MSTLRLFLCDLLGSFAARLGVKLNIPESAILMRATFAPQMGEALDGLIKLAVFEFPKSQPESIVWRRFFPRDGNIHWIGRRMERAATAAGRNKRYLGFVRTDARSIRAFRSAAGFGFALEHAPEEGLQHVHISFSANNGIAPNKQQKSELRVALVQEVFREKVAAPVA